MGRSTGAGRAGREARRPYDPHRSASGRAAGALARRAGAVARRVQPRAGPNPGRGEGDDRRVGIRAPHAGRLSPGAAGRARRRRPDRRARLGHAVHQPDAPGRLRHVLRDDLEPAGGLLPGCAAVVRARHGRRLRLATHRQAPPAGAVWLRDLGRARAVSQSPVAETHPGRDRRRAAVLQLGQPGSLRRDGLQLGQRRKPRVATGRVVADQKSRRTRPRAGDAGRARRDHPRAGAGTRAASGVRGHGDHHLRGSIDCGIPGLSGGRFA